MLPTMSWLTRMAKPLKCFFALAITTIALPPFLHSFATSILFVTWSMDTIRTNYEHLHAVEHIRWDFDNISSQYASSRLDDCAADGTGVPPFQVPKLWTFNWAERMGLERPLRHRWSEWWNLHKPGEGMDKLGSVDGLMYDKRKTSKNDGKMPQLWVYVTENYYGGENGPQTMGRNWMGGSLSFREVEAQGDWDRAFVDVVRWFREESEHDVEHTVGYLDEEQPSRTFFFVDSEESKFLVRVWGVRPPCLLHFTSEDVELDQAGESKKCLWEALLDVLEGGTDGEHSYDTPAEFLNPVIVRAIDLPLESTRHLFPDGDFRSEFDQLYRLVAGEDIWKLWPRFSARREFLARFVTYWTELPGSKGKLFKCLREIDGWSRKYLGRQSGTIRLQKESEGIGSMIGFLVAPLTMLLLRWIRRMSETYLGLSRPTRGSSIAR